MYTVENAYIITRKMRLCKILVGRERIFSTYRTEKACTISLYGCGGTKKKIYLKTEKRGKKQQQNKDPINRADVYQVILVHLGGFSILTSWCFVRSRGGR